MLTLTASESDNRHGADEALKWADKPHNEVLLQLHDAALVSREAGQKKLKICKPLDITRAGAGSGDFWATLFDLFFLTPLLGRSIGAAGGALLDSMRDVGIDDDCIREVRSNARA
jgi:uncharacterized membrane protein